MAAFGQPGGNLDQGQVALIVDPSKHLGRMGLNTVTVPVPANGVRFNTAGAFEALVPEHRRGNGDIKPGRRSPPLNASFNGHDNAKTQIIGNG